MREIILLVPEDGRDYKDCPAIVILERDGKYSVDTLDVSGERLLHIEVANLVAALAYVVTVLAGTPDVKYTIEE